MATPTVAEFLGAQQPLFAVLDAARDAVVPAVLADSRIEHASLYEGARGRAYASVAPYLVRLEPQCALLQSLTSTAWGNSVAVYATCDSPFAEVRRHLRRFLTVRYQGEKRLFRFYDPRVLRHFLPKCTEEELKEFFGPVKSYYTETRDSGILLRFTAESGRSAGEPVFVRGGD